MGSITVMCAMIVQKQPVIDNYFQEFNTFGKDKDSNSCLQYTNTQVVASLYEPYAGATMDNQRIVAVEWARLQGRRPRKAGSNARLGEHGIAIRIPILRVTTADGARGFGACHAGPEHAA